MFWGRFSQPFEARDSSSGEGAGAGADVGVRFGNFYLQIIKYIFI